MISRRKFLVAMGLGIGAAATGSIALAKSIPSKVAKKNEDIDIVAVLLPGYEGDRDKLLEQAIKEAREWRAMGTCGVINPLFPNIGIGRYAISYKMKQSISAYQTALVALKKYPDVIEIRVALEVGRPEFQWKFVKDIDQCWTYSHRFHDEGEWLGQCQISMM